MNMDKKNILVGAIVLVVLMAGYILFFRSNSGKNTDYYGNPPSMTEQSNPSGGQQALPKTSQPSNLQDQGAAAPSGGQLSPSPAQDTNTPSATVTAVTIKNFAFSPAQVTVKAGSTVRWTNQDSTAHTITSDDGKFNSGNLSTGGTFEFTFAAPGTYVYHCGIHPMMKATIVVQ